MTEKDEQIDAIIDSLSPNERKIVRFLKEKSIQDISKKSGLDETSILRALEFLENKGIIKIGKNSEKIIDLGINGILYKQKGLPERRLLQAISEKSPLEFLQAQKLSGLSENEFKAALGVLKRKALVNLINGKLIFSGRKQDIVKKSLEEQLLEVLPMNLEKLKPEQKFAFDSLKNRRDIVELNVENEAKINITELGKKLVDANISDTSDMIEALTPEIIKSGAWRGKKFRHYDIKSPVPKIHGGKRHFVNQATDYARKVWTELGFKEMTGAITQTGFWNFDALFTAQDHPVREIQDTFYIKDIKGRLPDKRIVNAIKEAHEKGVGKGAGWGGEWEEAEAKHVILRTHTTCLSAHMLAMLGKLKEQKDKRGKFFAIGKCFRNETVDWGHLFEFNQTEGIVIDPNGNFRNLLGYLEEFFKKMGFEKVKFVPSFFPYTEPSVEIYGYNSMKKVWMEIGGAGIMRPEVVIPLLGEYIPVLAWGPGFDRSIMEYYGIKDLRELYENDITKLREMKFWNK